MVSKNREYLANIIIEALRRKNGTASIVEICKYIWDNYEKELRYKGDLFYIWQYEMRWSGEYLSDQDIINRDHGIWSLN